MKFLSTFILIIAFFFSSYSQTNILSQLNVTDGFNYGAFEEYDGNYYLITHQVRGYLNPWLNQRATQFILNKYNKNSHQLVASVHLAGDTLQSAVIVAPQAYMVMREKNIHINYATRQNVGGQILVHNYYVQLDTALNFIVPNKPLPEITGWLSSGGFATKTDGGCIMGYFTDPDNLGTSKYLILDSLGNATGNDTLGAVNFTGYHPTVWIRELVELPDHTYIATGMEITGGNNPPGAYFGWVLYDDSMHQLDTFNVKHGLVQDVEAYTRSVYTERMIGLPSGSLISANNTPIINGNGYDAFPKIIKHTAATRFGVDDYIAFGPIDHTDTAHGNFSALRSVVYNPFDNNLYYPSITHLFNRGTSCAFNSDKSCLEIISVDTSLNLRWRKFIKLEGNCSFMGTVSVPDGRNGIFVTGRSYQDADILKEWVYYINDSTPSDNPTNINDIVIKKEDGFVLYPVPAEDEVNLISLDKEFKEATLYDLSGRLLFTQSIVSGRAVINTSQLSPGIYMVKATDKHGNTFQKKMVKR